MSASDPSEAAICSAAAFLESVYADPTAPSRPNSRAPTPMIVRSPNIAAGHLPSSSHHFHNPPFHARPQLRHWQNNTIDLQGSCDSPKTVRVVRGGECESPTSPALAPSGLQHWEGQATSTSAIAGLQRSHTTPALRHDRPYQPLQHSVTPSQRQNGQPKHFMTATTSVRVKKALKRGKANYDQGESSMGPPPTPSRRLLNRPSAFPQQPDVSSLSVSCDPNCEYAVVISMYEVYNDRIFDLLTPPIKSAATKEYRRRPLLFKSTEASPDRKVVTGLRKVVCGNLQQALMILEAGLHERRVAGTGSNSVSSRSHGFICVEVKKRARPSRRYPEELAWGGSTLTIVDLAGSERARDAKTAGATLAEAGKINESLMYLGQCLQMQSDSANKEKVSKRYSPSSFSVSE